VTFPDSSTSKPRLARVAATWSGTLNFSFSGTSGQSEVAEKFDELDELENDRVVLACEEVVSSPA